MDRYDQVATGVAPDRWIRRARLRWGCGQVRQGNRQLGSTMEYQDLDSLEEAPTRPGPLLIASSALGGGTGAPAADYQQPAGSQKNRAENQGYRRQ